MNVHQKALLHLSKRDKIMAGIVGRTKLKTLKPNGNNFQALTKAIISQQLSSEAAEAITKRFIALFGNGSFPTPEQTLKASDQLLRTSGLSGSKIAYIKNVSSALKNRELNFHKLIQTTDEEIIQTLTKLKGIGRWTAEMFLIFSLDRPDVFSKGDSGLKKAVKKLYQIDVKRHHKKMKRLLALWKPHRSSASRLLWASLDKKNG